MSRAYFSLGLDISGTSNNRSQLVITRMKNLRCETVLLGNIPSLTGYKKKLSVKEYADLQNNYIKEKVKEVRKRFWTDLPSDIPLAVDVPIDLSEILNYLVSGKDDFIKNVAKITHKDLLWRSIDKKYDGFSPLGSNIGQVVMRFRNIFFHSDRVLGENLFETYPKACLKEIGKRVEGSLSFGKNDTPSGTKVTWNNYSWDNVDQTQNQKDFLGVLKKLSIYGPYKKILEVNEDHFDAIICSLVGLRDKYCIHHDSQVEPYKLPEGYRLIKNKFWTQIEIVGDI